MTNTGKSIFLHTLKVMLLAVVLSGVVEASFHFFSFIGVLKNDAVLFDIDQTSEEMWKQLPAIGNWIGNALDIKGAWNSTGTLQVEVFSQVSYALILFFSYKIMNGIRSVVDEFFAVFDGEKSFLALLSGLFETVVIVFCAIIEANVIYQLANDILSFAGAMWSTVILLCIIIVSVYLMVLIGRKQGVVDAAINTAFEMALGLIVVCLIYLAVALFQMSSGLEYMTTSEAVFVYVGDILCFLALTVLGAKSFADTICRLLKT